MNKDIHYGLGFLLLALLICMVVILSPVTCNTRIKISSTSSISPTPTPSFQDKWDDLRDDFQERAKHNPDQFRLYAMEDTVDALQVKNEALKPIAEKIVLGKKSQVTEAELDRYREAKKRYEEALKYQLEMFK